MRLVSTINKKQLPGFLLLLLSIAATSQENSPYSRYGLGDIFPGQHILNRGMGGISAAYRDPLEQSINFYNPASYGRDKKLPLSLISYDIGIVIDSRTLKSATPVGKFSSTNFTPAYVVLGMPLNKKRGLGLAFGLRPLSKINYSIVETKRVPQIDSVSTLYEGTGGLYQIFVGVGKRWRGLSLGVNGNYNFGRKETDTRTIFRNDSVNYSLSNYGTTTTYHKVGLTGGLQIPVQYR